MVPTYQFVHDDFEGMDLFAASRNCKIEEEGPPSDFFDQIPLPSSDIDKQQPPRVQDDATIALYLPILPHNDF